MTRLLCIATAAAALLLAGGCTGSDDKADGSKAKEAQKVKFLTGLGVQGREAYIYVGMEKGYFKEAGFEVEVVPGNGTNQNLQLLQGGQADFAVLDITAAFMEYGKGAFKDFTIVSAIQQRNLACFMAMESSGIATARDLAGKKIAYIPGGVVRQLFATYAKLAGIDSSKIEWVNMPAQQMGQGLASGSIHAATQFVVGKPAIEAAAQGKKVVVLPYSDYLNDLYGNGLAVTKKALKDDPDRVKRFNEAMLKGLKFAIENPAEAAKIYTKYQKIQPEPVAAAELTLMAPYVKFTANGVPVGALDEGKVARNIAILQGASAIPGAFDPKDIVAFDLVPKG
jgi:NitT/TauT family transport system substrate-binding protein